MYEDHVIDISTDDEEEVKFITKSDFEAAEKRFLKPVKKNRVIDADTLDSPAPREEGFEMIGPLTTVSFCSLGIEQKESLETKGCYLDDELVTMALL